MVEKSDQLGLIGAISIGIGGMVGGGIFAVLGLAVDLTRGGVVLAFLFAGIIAMITSYSFAKLSLAYPSDGGTVEFINKGFGHGIFSGGTNNLLWISYIVMLSLYAAAFGSYASNLIGITGNAAYDKHIFTSGVIILATLINFYSVSIVGEIESFAVVVKLIILIGFVAIGLYMIGDSKYVSQLAPRNWTSPAQMIAGGMIIFVAYEGFELIANAASRIVDPKRNIPRAFYISVVFVVVLYILIAGITVGTLEFSVIADAKDYVLAKVAEPSLGPAGFYIMSAAAMLSTFSAINATVYGGSRVNYQTAKDGELPTEFTRKFWGQPVGVLVIAGATLILANLVDLNSISTSGSAGFLLIFGLVNYVCFKKAHEVGGSRTVSAIGAALCFLALTILIIQQIQTNFFGASMGISIIAAGYVIEIIYRKGDQKEKNE
ncbi:MAG: amino acid permease [Acidobacteria bacterium]|nr:amino acid permease [Acidobacteriota bacterium]